MKHPFRPVRSVVDPSGDYWGIFVSRVAPVGWKPGAEPGMDPIPMFGLLGILGFPIVVVIFLWRNMLLPFLRMAVLTPAAVIKGRRSDCVWIYAQTLYGGQRETRTWTTTRTLADGVINEIALALTQGKLAQPLGAVYSGARDD